MGSEAIAAAERGGGVASFAGGDVAAAFSDFRHAVAPCLPLQAYYYDGIPLLSDSEFDNLKQELQWEGSKVVVLRWVRRSKSAQIL